MKDFVHLHLHTQFSLLDGAIRFDNLFNLAKKFKMGACSITDHGNMFGAADFYFSAMESGIKPIIGCEAYIAPKSRFDQKRIKGEENAYHILLLAINNEGYKNLIKLTSLAHLEGFYYVPRIDKELLTNYNSGLICLTACIKGEIPSLILKNEEKALKETIQEYLSIFGDRLYFELQDNGLEEQKTVNETLIKLSRYYNIPIVATNDCHYLKKEEARAHELLLCIQTGKTIHDKDRMSFQSDEFYFKSQEQIALAFSGYPEALYNTLKIAEQCNVSIETGTYHFPEFKLPENSKNIPLDDYFEGLCRKGFEERMSLIKNTYENFNQDAVEQYKARLDYEMNVIRKTGFTSYFLIVADFIRFAKAQGIPVGPGRGSAAGSLAAYCLGITDIDPLKYDLLFERFLNPERISLPDIDVDFCMDGREKVIHYVTEKYGRDNVAQIITFGTMQSRAAVRDVGRALGMAYAEVDRIAKLIPATASTIAKAIQEEPQLKELYKTDDRVKDLLDNAMVLEGLARHASTHAAGIVISNKALSHHVPLYRGTNGETITQYPMKTIEKIGLVKFDFLGLKTLTIIDRAIKLLKSEGVDISIEDIPLDDSKTYELLSSGQTSGVFQLESRGMKDLLMKVKPSKFEDVVALIALYRPGPLQSGMMDEFIRRKNNPSLIKYETPLLEDILKDTYGVIIYQEQIMKIASTLANFPLKDSDTLRKAISKKIPEELENYKERFIKGAIANGVAPAIASRIYDVILRFGEYGFNKSHSTAYAVVAYQTAYLKAHYYTHFMAALLTSEVNNTDNLIKYITECRENGVEILPPDINKSNKQFTIVGNKIRFGLSGIKNVGDAAIDSIIKVRNELGEFSALTQFCDVIDSRKANKKVLESLAKAGCFDSLGLKRSQIFHLIKEKSDKPQKRERRNGKQLDIFGASQGFEAPFEIPDLEELPYTELLKGEKEALGFYFTEHPLKSYEKIIQRITSYDTQTIKETDATEDVSIVGIVNSFKQIVTKKGDKMAYMTIEDTKGIVETIVFPDLYAKYKAIMETDRPLIISGSLEKMEDGNVKIRAKNIMLLENALIELNRCVKITIQCHLFKKEDLRKLRDILLNIKGNTKVVLEFQLNGEKASLNMQGLRIDHTKIDIISKHFGDAINCEVIDEILS